MTALTTRSRRRRRGGGTAGVSSAVPVLSAAAAAAAVAVVGASSSATSTTCSARPTAPVAAAAAATRATAVSFGVRPPSREPFRLNHVGSAALGSLRGGSSATGDDGGNGTGDAATAAASDEHVATSCDANDDDDDEKIESSAGGGGGSVDGSSVRGGAVGEAEGGASARRKKRRSKNSKKKKKKIGKESNDADTHTTSSTGAAEADASATSTSSSTEPSSPAASAAASESSSSPSSSATSSAADDKSRHHHGKHKHGQQQQQHHSSHSNKSHHHRHHGEKSHRTSSKKRNCAQQDAIIQNILTAPDHYEVLDVTKTATEVEIKKAYRRRAVRTHPDKVPSGDRTAFDKVARAYEVLSDEGKRALYDRFGDAGVDAGGNPNPGFGGGAFRGGPGGMGSAEDIFRSFFGAAGPGMPGSGRPNNPFQPRNRNARYQMEVSLEDLYSGLTRSVTIAQPSASAGKRRKTVEVTVPRGMGDGQTVVLPGEIDHVAGSAPADVIFVLAQRRHPVFSRRGHDLAIEVTISLREALCGFRRRILHLDGRTVVIGPPRAPGKRQPEPLAEDEDTNVEPEENARRQAPVLVRSGDVHVLRGEGMPKPAGSKSNGRGGGFGDLYVQYKVEMPSATSAAGDNLTMEERDELDRLLRKLEGGADVGAQVQNNTSLDDDKIDKDGNIIRYLERASASDFGRASGIFEQDNHHGEEHLHHDDDDDHQHSSFFHAFGGGRGGPASGFQYFSSSRGPSQDDPNVQCQQM
mmetsp:Transcript_30763/g.62364  ORF Transcript_30763/g.62364 Transcript_30763/m.62364 type:complete len:752 (+) Transcript_30763:96-2351(+)